MKRKSIPPSLLSFEEIYLTYWRKYSDALYDSIQRVARYRRSLLVWDGILQDVADYNVCNILKADYVEPVLRLCLDYPIKFKDELTRGIVSLTNVTKYGKRALRTIKEINAKRSWIDKYRAIVDNNTGLTRIKKIVDEFYDSNLGKAIRDVHGASVHDASSTLVSGVPFVNEDENGYVFYGYEKTSNIADFIKLIDSVYLVMCRAYEEFYEFADESYKQYSVSYG